MGFSRPRFEGGVTRHNYLVLVGFVPVVIPGITQDDKKQLDWLMDGFSGRNFKNYLFSNMDKWWLMLDVNC